MVPVYALLLFGGETLVINHEKGTIALPQHRTTFRAQPKVINYFIIINMNLNLIDWCIDKNVENRSGNGIREKNKISRI